MVELVGDLYLTEDFQTNLIGWPFLLLSASLSPSCPTLQLVAAVVMGCLGSRVHGDL